MKKYPELTVLLVVLALVIVLASSPFNDGITGHATKETKESTSKTSATSSVKAESTSSWWERFVASITEDDATAIPAESADAQSEASDSDIPYDDNRGYNDYNFVETEDDTAELDSEEDVSYQMDDQLSMYPDETDALDSSDDACGCDESISDGCSTTVSDRVSDLNDRVTDLENQQTSTSCGSTPTLGAGCNIKVIDKEIMVIPGEKYDCNDACNNGQHKQCVFGMLTWTNANDGFVTSSYLVPCTEERTPKMTQTRADGTYYEKRITCACC